MTEDTDRHNEEDKREAPVGPCGIHCDAWKTNPEMCRNCPSTIHCADGDEDRNRDEPSN